ncbi:nitrilase-related carbon-nitrogen hydrolase [Pontivivens insulae]|uniref:(R)-stereoselective amidase n=1 Tax=Pontivivens insulae TaxID=1639689 RepID=A0A2R8ABN5_9RHOB|nr:nitrilase-related carbon-nitrogen hydrolase [Pontivivens insulae]RED11357.1 putative amidohydrolase [Pontivivens insulae]SPF29470.1 (R)-stereoselective amidase [Pontivivens insulae]
MRLSLLQSAPTSSPEAFLEVLRDAATEAREGGADLLVTPEMALTGYTIGAAAVRELAAPFDRAHWAGVAEIAEACGIAIAAGGPEAPRYNAAALFDATGALRMSYRKTHLYGDVDATQFDAGEAISNVIEFGGLRIGLAICFDIEFSEVARCLRRAGADLILVPTANMKPYQSVATRLVPARAQENGVAIAYANPVGFDGTFDYCGLSCICAADGDDLARAGDDAPALIFADVNRDDVTRVRADLDYLSQTRTELYR